MRITLSPVPFDPAGGYTMDVSAGMPLDEFNALPVPPNPPGVVIQENRDRACVEAAPDTPPGTKIRVDVTDTPRPAQTAPTVSAVA